MSRYLLSTIAAVLFASHLNATTILNVSLDTHTLMGSTAGPFSFAAQFAPGSGELDGNNSASLSNFDFDRGSAGATSPTLIGGASGDLLTSVAFRESDFQNFFSQGFVPGSILSFSVRMSTNSDVGGINDELVVYILDSTGAPLPTTAGAFADYLFSARPENGNLTIETFSGDTSRSPLAGGGPISIAAPSVTAVPEPRTTVCVMAAFLGIAWLQRQRLRWPS